MFAGQELLSTKIKTVTDPQVKSDMVLKSLYLQRNTGWETRIRTNLKSTIIPESIYLKEENLSSTEILLDDYSPLGIKRVGNVQYKSGKLLIFKKPIEY